MGKEEVILIFKESGFLFKGPMMQRYNILCNVSRNEKLLNAEGCHLSGHLEEGSGTTNQSHQSTRSPKLGKVDMT